MPTATTAADNELIADNPADKDTANNIDNRANINQPLSTFRLSSDDKINPDNKEMLSLAVRK